MPSTINFLGATDALVSQDTDGNFRDPDAYVSNWTILTPDASYAIDDSKEASLAPTYYGMKVAPPSSDPVVLVLQNQAITSTQATNTQLAFSANVKSNNELNVRCALMEQGLPPGGAPFSDTLNIPSKWTSFRSNYHPMLKDGSLQGTSNYNMHVQLTVSNHAGEPFYITACALIDDFAFAKNSFVQTAKAKYLPNFYWDLDAAESDPTYPMYKLLDIMTTTSYHSMQTYSQWFDYEVGELQAQDDPTAKWTRSGLTDPKYVANSIRPWLAQFIGAVVRANIRVAPNQVDNAGVAISGSGNDKIQDWVPTADEAAFLEWQLTNGYFGYASGTRQAAIEAVKLILTGDKVTSVDPGITVDQGTSKAAADGDDHVVLSTASSTVNDAYNGMTVTILSDTGPTANVGEVRTIATWPASNRYVGGSDRKAYVTQDWPVTPNSETTYRITSPWHVLIETITSETPDAGSDGDVSAAVLNALELAKPMGFVFSHLAFDALNFKLNSFGRGRLNGFPLQ